MIDYNVPGGKLNRGMAVYDVLAAIKGAEHVTREEAFKANALGWCIEWVHARCARRPPPAAGPPPPTATGRRPAAPHLLSPRCIA